MKNELKKHKKEVERELEIFFNKKIKKTQGINKKIIKQLKEFTLRGKSKRIRSFLITTGYHSFGGKKQKEIIKASVFIELIQSFFLIHDDIIDQDDFRRGKSTFHKIFEKQGGHHFGKSMAIMAGDIVYVLALESFLSADFSNNIKLKVIKKINETVFDTGQGQILDIWLGEQNSFNNQKDILAVYKNKTAKYTFEAPLHIGALLAGASNKNLKLLSNYAIPLGIVFQIQDDILGVFGDQQKIGKPVGSDIREKKKTLLIWKTFQNANQKEKKRLLQLFNQKTISKKEISEIKQIIINTGALDWTKNYAKRFGLNAQKQLSNLSNIDLKNKNILSELINYIIKRNY